MEFDEIKIKFNANIEKLEFQPDSGTPLDYKFEIEPEDFLSYAENDLSVNPPQLINALSNAKRAIDCSIKKTLMVFSLKPKENNFPSKVKTIEEIGIIAPRILNRVIKNRNFVEHDYKKPTEKDVIDAVDIAHLFVSSIRGTLRLLTDNFIISEDALSDGKLKSCLYFSLDDNHKIWEVRWYDDKSKLVEAKIGSNHRDFKKLIKLTIAFDRSNSKAYYEALNSIFDMGL